MISAATISRRSVLGAGLLAAAACTHRSSPPAPRVDPDASALADARAAEATLIAATTDPAERATHLAHLVALGGRPPTSSASPSPTTSSTTSPAPSTESALRDSAQSLRGASVAAIDGAHAATLASIAASHEVMAREGAA